MRVTSCDCFDGNPIKVRLNEDEQCLELEQKYCDNNSDKETFRVSTGSYVFNLYYCPFCGKKIEINNEIMYKLVKIVFKDGESTFIHDVNDEELQKSLKEKEWHQFPDGQMVDMNKVREIIPIRPGD